MNNRIITAVLTAVALLSLACGSGGGSSTSSGGNPPPVASRAPVTTVPIGQPLTLTEVLFGTKTVATVTVTNLKVGVKSGNQFVKPAKGQFITADVTVQVSDGKFSINSSMFKLVAADGTAFDTTIILDQNDISGNDLTPGQKVTGAIAFDATVGAEKGARIALKSWLADGDAGYWQLP